MIDDYLALECSQGRMAGPFPEPPFYPFHCSGMGVVPKQDGSHRVITHLSAPPGRSINDHINPEAVTLTYTSVDRAIGMANDLGKGTLFAKIDLKCAFRQCLATPHSRVGSSVQQPQPADWGCHSGSSCWLAYLAHSDGRSMEE